MRHLGISFLLTAALASLASGQTGPPWDNSGNQLLTGTYNYRHVQWVTSGIRGDVSRAKTIYGDILFDGSGGYKINAQIMDSGSSLPVPVTYQKDGTYRLASNGYGFMSGPFATIPNDSLYIMTSGAIVTGSSTESGVNDFMVAAQQGAPAPTNANLNGKYWVSHLDLAPGALNLTRDSTFALDANGQGGLATIAATGYIGTTGRLVTQSITGATYSLRAGGGLLNLNGTVTASTLIAGQKVIYVSNDNFIFGGSPSGFDFFVGVKASTAPGTAALRDGLYYMSGAYVDVAQYPALPGDFETFYGAFKSGNGTAVLHRRLLNKLAGDAYDFTYSRTDAVKADATFDTETIHYVLGANGAIQVGSGKGTYLGLGLALRAPTFNGSGVFLDPTGVVNAASSAPFTVGISPGGLMTLYGTGLSTSTLVDGTFPFILGGVRVLVNNRPAPIYVVSPGQISAIAPWGTTEFIATVQVVNNGVSSNVVTQWVNFSTPGVFTNPTGGLGLAAVLHTDFSLVTRASPARPGETIQLYVAGLGTVKPAVADRAVGPSSPLSLTENEVVMYVDNNAAKVSFSGLPPGLTGLYQINLQIPASVRTGDLEIDVAGPGAYTSEALLPVRGNATSTVPDESAVPQQRTRRLHKD